MRLLVIKCLYGNRWKPQSFEAFQQCSISWHSIVREIKLPSGADVPYLKRSSVTRCLRQLRFTFDQQKACLEIINSEDNRYRFRTTLLDKRNFLMILIVMSASDFFPWCYVCLRMLTNRPTPFTRNYLFEYLRVILNYVIFFTLTFLYLSILRLC